MLKKISISNVFQYLSVVIIGAFILSPIIYFYLYSYEISDINYHTEYARILFESPQDSSYEIITHSAWHWLVIFTHEVINKFAEKSWRFSAFIVTISFELLTIGLLFWQLKKELSPLPAGLLSIGVLIIQPLMVFPPIGHHLRLGYIWVNTYANPTSIMLQPLAILQCLFSIEAFQGKKSNWKMILLAAVISLAAAFSKPSYAICLIPALGIFMMIGYLKKKHINWKLLFLGLIFPTLAILTWQYILVYGSGEESRVFFAPFVVMSRYLPNLFIKFFLSIAFPLIVTLVFWKESIKDIRIQFGWTGFGIGAMYTYLFAESGWRFTSGNFLFCGVITLFILFVCSILFLIEKKLIKINNILKYLTISSGLLHIIYGIYFYFYSLATISPPNPFK